MFWLKRKHCCKQAEEGVLPLEGSIPDMWSTTEMYLKLQRVYRARAEADAAKVLSIAQALQKDLGPSSTDLTEFSRHFCRHASHLRVARFRPLQLELSNPHNMGCLMEVWV